MPTIDFDILFTLAALLVGSLVVLDVYLSIKFLRNWRKSPPESEEVDPPTLTAAGRRWQRVIQAVHPFRFVILHIVFLGIATFLLARALSPIPVIQSTYPARDANWNDYSQPITIVFNVPVQISKLRPNISVEGLEGEWRYERYLGILPVTRVARFYPANTLLPNQRIVVYMTGVARWMVNEDHEHAHNFFSQKEPEVMSTSPENSATEVDINSEIAFHLTALNQPYNKWDFEITPEVEFALHTPDRYTFTMKPSKPLAQSQTYTVNVYRTAITYNTQNQAELSRDNRQLVHTLTFTARKAPLVKRFTPTGTGVKEKSEIEIIFDLPMKRESVEAAWSINPPVAGTFRWTNDQTLTFTPSSPLPKETEYVVTLPAGLQSLNGGVSETDVSYSFTTIGAVRVNSFSPSNGSVRIARNTPIRINFDQDVDQNSAASKLSISPGAPGTISWEGANLIFTPSSPWAFNTTYTVSLSPGIKSIEGLDSRETFNMSFTTVSNQTLIAGFNLDLQDYDFTCSVAAAKMVLAWKGINASETTLVNIMGEDISPWAWNGSLNSHTWGDPNRAFLGFHTNGSGSVPGPGASNTHPAYGALWFPIMKAYAAYGVQTELRTGWDVVSMAREIAAGHPVQIWWYNGVSGGQTMTWVDNQTGSTVYAIQGMHSVDVIGFNGDVDNPTSFIVMDPWWGYQTYSVAKFNWQWPYMNNTALVIK